MELTQTVYADRSERGKLRLTGEQRTWFLHQILTQAFEDIEPGEARDAALLTAHGRMVGFLEAVATDDAILCHFEPELRATLPDAIRRYQLATRVEIEDVTEQYSLVLLAGPGWDEAARLAPAGSVVHRSFALGAPAAYLWIVRADVADFRFVLSEQGLKEASEDELEALRVANGIARWGRDMNEKSFPQEAEIDERAVHYDKGCYVGQEAMAKIHLRGKVNRRLRRLEAEGDLQAGWEVQLDGEKVGEITSAFGGRALALLKHTVEAGAEVQVGHVAARVRPAGTTSEEVEQRDASL